MALARRKLPKPPLNLDKMDATSPRTPITSLTEPTNSEGETLRHADPPKPVREPETKGVHCPRNSINKNVNVMVGVLDGSFVEESAIIGGV